MGSFPPLAGLQYRLQTLAAVGGTIPTVVTRTHKSELSDAVTQSTRASSGRFMTFPERPLERVTVNDVMHTGILMTDPETPLKTVARLMADRKVHAVAGTDPGAARGPFGIISTLDIATAVATGENLTAADASREGVITMRADEQLENPASLMVEKQTEHLLVINPATGHAEGVLSALDVAGAYGARP